MSDIETRIGLDLERLNQTRGTVIKEYRNNMVEAHRRTDAWKWFISEKLQYLFDGIEIVQSSLNGDCSTLSVDLLAFHRKEVEEIANYIDSCEYLRSNKTDDDGKLGYVIDTWNNCITYTFAPELDLFTYMRNRFGIKNNRYYFEVRLRFFPQEGGECEIVDDGVEIITREQKKFAFKCKEGASAW